MRSAASLRAARTAKAIWTSASCSIEGTTPDAESRFAAQLELRRHLTPATVGRDVDVVVLNDAPPPLGRRIVRGERVYCMDAEADHAFQRDVQLRAADLAPFLEKMRRLLHASLSR